MAGVTIPPTDIGIPTVSANDQSIATIVNVVFTIIGALAIISLMVAAFLYITSGGDQSQIQKAKNTILYTVIGIAVSLLAFGIVQFVLGQIIG